MTNYQNTDERYGDPVFITIEDYRELNPDGDFSADEFGIYEIVYTFPGVSIALHTRTEAEEVADGDDYDDDQAYFVSHRRQVAEAVETAPTSPSLIDPSDLVDDLVEWMGNCENLPPATIAYMSTMSIAYAKAVMQILRNDSRSFSDAELLHIATYSPYADGAWAALALLNKREDQYTCPQCGGDECVGRHGVTIPGGYNEPPDYECYPDEDLDSAYDDIEF